jgi:hypothetical protein
MLARRVRDRNFFPQEVQAKPRCQFRSEFLVCPGFGAAQTVLKVQNREANAQLLLKIVEQQQERHRIRSSRDGKAQAVARNDHATPLEHISDAAVESRGHTQMAR